MLSDIERPIEWVFIKETIETLCSLFITLVNAIKELYFTLIILASIMKDFNGKIQEFKLIIKDERVPDPCVLGKF